MTSMSIPDSGLLIPQPQVREFVYGRRDQPGITSFPRSQYRIKQSVCYGQVSTGVDYHIIIDVCIIIYNYEDGYLRNDMREGL